MQKRYTVQDCVRYTKDLAHELGYPSEIYTILPNGDERKNQGAMVLNYDREQGAVIQQIYEGGTTFPFGLERKKARNYCLNVQSMIDALKIYKSSEECNIQ